MKVALVTGSNRGIGFETCIQLGNKGFHVIMTARNETDRDKAHQELEQKDIKINSYILDVDDPESIANLRKNIGQEFHKLDVLVNNAGIANRDPILNVEYQEIMQVFSTNVFGPWLMIQQFADLLQKSGDGRIINVSSGYGKIENQGSHMGTYRLSKLSLNGLTLAFSDQFGTKIAINSMTPGWVDTRLGGKHAPKSVIEGADTIVWLSTVEPTPTGKFFRERQEISW